MIGFYDYTVWLTYLSLISGGIGIMVCLSGFGHPFIGMFFLLVSGLCDTFDGKVARTKKNRTDAQKAYGIQIDSLSDLVAFGVLPACIGVALISVSDKYTYVPHLHRLLKGTGDQTVVYPILLFGIMLFYILAAMIRLAYFNVLEEERQKTEGGARAYYLGLPVTSAALIFPAVLLLQFVTKADHTLMYFAALLITGILFLTRIQVRKPKNKGLAVLVIIGAVEFILLIVVKYLAAH